MRNNVFLQRIVCLIGFCVISSLAFGSIQGSKHDFSSLGWSNGEICLPCHTPHNALTTVPDAPIWNHQLTTATFTLYTSDTLKGTPPESPRGTTKLCLSCHDGTVALDSFGNMSGSNMIAGSANLGTNLSDDHPVSIVWSHKTNSHGGGGGSGYCSYCHKSGFPKSSPSSQNGRVKFSYYGSAVGYIECSTCHEVHNSQPYEKLLRQSMVKSALCFICHTNKV